jgi:release factor glutamine methyltransferase
MLADQLRRERLGPGVSVLDLCTGSGHLAVVAALEGATTVAIDVSHRAVFSVRLNARLNGVRVAALRGNLFEPVAGHRFDVIVSNPPYLPHPDEDLPRRGLRRAIDAGPRGRAFLDRICAQVDQHLKPGGVLLLVHSSVCGEQATIDALSARGLKASVVFRHRGPLGPTLGARREWLRHQGLLLPGDLEDVIIVRAAAPSPATGDRTGPPGPRDAAKRPQYPANQTIGSSPVGYRTT